MLGYIQLVVVLTGFITVSRKMSKYEKRFGHLRRGRTLTFENGKLQVIEIKPTQEMRTRCVRQNSSRENAGGNSDISTSASRGISTLVEEEQGNNHSNDNSRYQTNGTFQKPSPAESQQACRGKPSVYQDTWVSGVPFVNMLVANHCKCHSD